MLPDRWQAPSSATSPRRVSLRQRARPGGRPRLREGDREPPRRTHVDNDAWSTTGERPRSRRRRPRSKARRALVSYGDVIFKKNVLDELLEGGGRLRHRGRLSPRRRRQQVARRGLGHRVRAALAQDAPRQRHAEGDGPARPTPPASPASGPASSRRARTAARSERPPRQGQASRAREALRCRTSSAAS